MQKSKSFTPEAVLRGYFHAKDENRPHLLEDVFASDAELLIHNQSANIAFPAFTQGRSAIAEVLVRSFTLSNENVYSFYLSRPLSAVREFTCPWLVDMSERFSGHIRVGCGTYEWLFEQHAPHMAAQLVITIERSPVPHRSFPRPPCRRRLNPIERTSSGKLRLPTAAAHVKN